MANESLPPFGVAIDLFVMMSHTCVSHKRGSIQALGDLMIMAHMKLCWLEYIWLFSYIYIYTNPIPYAVAADGGNI